MKLRYALALIVALITSLSLAQTPLAIPNTFTNGEIIDADQINQNFNALAQGVNNGFGKRKLYSESVFVADIEIYLPNNNTLMIMSDAGGMYLSTSVNSGTVDLVLRNSDGYYLTSDCTGNIYVIVNGYSDFYSDYMISVRDQLYSFNFHGVDFVFHSNTNSPSIGSYINGDDVCVSTSSVGISSENYYLATPYNDPSSWRPTYDPSIKRFVYRNIEIQ